MPKKTPVTSPCSECGDPVRQTRPSASGLHFCRKLDCQKAKSRRLYQKRLDNQAGLERGLLLDLIHALAARPRKQCPECGLTNALPGYKHPLPDGTACSALGATQMGSLAIHIVSAIWPYSSRTYAEVSS